MNDYWFEFAGKRHTFAEYGADFLTDLQKLVEGHIVKSGQQILEWGSGLSTLLFADIAAARGAHVVSLDDNAEYQKAVAARIKHQSSVRLFAANLVGPRMNDSDPGLNYGTLPLSLGTEFDLIFIDGRRRMECALAATMLCRDDSLVIMHDYRRRRYQLVRALYDIVEDGRQFRVMRPKPEMLAKRGEVCAHFKAPSSPK